MSDVPGEDLEAPLLHRQSNWQLSKTVCDLIWVLRTDDRRHLLLGVGIVRAGEAATCLICLAGDPDVNPRRNG